MIKILHNPECTKSNCALNFLTERKEVFEVIDYQKQRLSEQEIEELLGLLGIPAEELVRKSEPVFKENFDGKTFSNSEWVHILAENPILIQRPIVISGNKAVIGRPIELVAELLG
jgi:arsenate reductase